MQKINFQDLPSTTTPINASNLNQVQDNMEGAFKNSYSTSQNDGYNCDYINNMSAKLDYIDVNITIPAGTYGAGEEKLVSSLQSLGLEYAKICSILFLNMKPNNTFYTVYPYADGNLYIRFAFSKTLSSNETIPLRILYLKDNN